MSKLIPVKWETIIAECNRLATRHDRVNYYGVHGIPTGANSIVGVIGQILELPIIEQLDLTDYNKQAILVVDDLVDSGGTLNRYMDSGYINVDALFRKPHSPKNLAPQAKEINGWIEFPWERDRSESPAEDSIVRILEAIGENPDRDGLKETPKRVVRSWLELFSGYRKDPLSVIKTFEGPEKYDEIIYLRDIEMYSTCEHHMLPFYGKAHIAYIPNGKVIGVSKLARLLEIFSRRLQIQERICSQVTGILMDELNALGAACIIEAKHLCIACRGIGKQNSVMGTSSIQGVFRDKAEARAELMTLLIR